MKNKSGLLIAFLFIVAGAKAGPGDEGRTIFISRCASCHNVHKVIVGPALGGVDQRHSIDWIVNFVHSSQSMIKKGDKDAVTLFEKFNKVPMPDHSDLTADNIRSIVEYIKKESKTVTTPAAKSGKKENNYYPLSWQQDHWFFVVYAVVVLMLIIALLFVVELKKWQSKSSTHPG